MNKITDPTPAPFPSEARPFPLTRLPVAFPVAFPLEGRGVPHGAPAAGKAVATPLPCRGFFMRQQLPSLVGEGQGWGQ